MKDKEERKLQFILRYYEDGKLDTRKALKKNNRDSASK